MMNYSLVHWKVKKLGVYETDDDAEYGDIDM